jgi:hypothetical protein
LVFVYSTKSLYTNTKASALGAAWSLLPSLELMSWMLLGTFLVIDADDLDVAWNLPPSFGRPLDAAWSLPPCYLCFPFDQLLFLERRGSVSLFLIPGSKPVWEKSGSR